MVGGLVRDHLLGLEGNDYDLIVENILFNDLIEFLTDAGGELDLVGQSFLVIKYKTAIRQYDISVPRTDRNTGLGHQGFEIQACKTIEEDLARRDFTINAIAFNVHTNTLVDPLMGQHDLEHKVINVTYGLSFIEDPLRIIRLLRFCSKFKFQISLSTSILLKGALPMLSDIAIERFTLEMEKLKSFESTVLFIHTCIYFNVLPHLFGMEIGTDTEERKNIFLNHYWSPYYGPELTIAMLYYSHNIHLDTDKLPVKYRKRALAIQRVVESEYLHSTKQHYDAQLLLQSIDLFPEIRNNWEGSLQLSKIKLVSELAVSGHDVVNLGYQGVEVGKALLELRLAIFVEGLENTRDELLRHLK